MKNEKNKRDTTAYAQIKMKKKIYHQSARRKVTLWKLITTVTTEWNATNFSPMILKKINLKNNYISSMYRQ